MRCPECQHEDTRVIDSRTAGDAIRRRRQCMACSERFTTHERVELKLPLVVKKDGRREPFSRDKVLHGILLACRKRPVQHEQMDEAVRRVEQIVMALREPEIPSERVGEAVMEVLRGVDAVAYVRFASVYQAFESVEQFAETISSYQEER